jgi:DNA mismatch repair protein MutS
MSASTRPMYRKYYEVWSAHREKYGPRTALLYQVGGFFEIYDTENLTTGTTEANIREIAELCQLSLSIQSIDGSDKQSLFGGFPEHALGKFERILVHAGFTVVVVVQRKNSAGAVEERVVDHISSPGCYVDGTKERRLVGCILESLTDGPAALQRVYWAVSALDVATGRIWFAEGADRDRFHQFLCMHPPSELVIWSDGAAAAVSLSGTLAAACSATHLRCLSSAAVAVELSVLDKHWSPATKRLDWVSRLPQARRCLAALMEFAADHMPSALVALRLPEAWVPTGEVRLGNAALEQLGLLSLKEGGGDNKHSLLAMMDQCRSIAGRRLLRERLMRPISDVTELRARLGRIRRAGEAMDVPTITALTERSLRSLYDMSRLWRRLELSTATISDMACLLRAYDAAATLLDHWTESATATATEEDTMGLYLGWVSARWKTDTASELAREGRNVPVSVLPWVTGTRPTVEAAFAKGAHIRTRAIALCQRWSSLGRGEQLYLDDAEGGGFRVTGTKRRISSVLTALRDGGDTSAACVAYKSTATLETAELEAISTEHRAWYQKWLGVWAEGWTAACAELVEHGRTIHTELTAWCADLDLSWTIARLSKEWLWKEPVYIDGASEASVEVRRLRHPILERLVSVPYVAHSVALAKGDTNVKSPEELTHTNAGLLLYGMNASGKSSLMKALGLAVILAQCGFPVPAASMRLAPFTAIFTRILGNDNLWAGLSSFAVEMTEFREILRFADKRSLVLGDELCSGTESLSATALVAAGVETLAARRTKFVFATHLHELATLPDIAGLTSVRAVHLKVHYDATTDRLIYDRHLADGAGSALYGLEVCRALDLPLEYLDRATALRKTLAGWQAPHTSSYSTAAVVSACAICGATGESARLETHHIRPQMDAAAAEIEGVNIHTSGNLVCLCAKCHDNHHAGLLVIDRWEETSTGRRLVWSSASAPSETNDELTAWIREQRRLKIRIPTIQRVAKQIFGVELTAKDVRSIV